MKRSDTISARITEALAATVSAVILALTLFVVRLPAAAQTAVAGQPVMVEDVFKNVQVLKVIPANEFMDTM